MAERSIDRHLSAAMSKYAAKPAQEVSRHRNQSSRVATSWRGREGRATWCRLFMGDRFTNGPGMGRTIVQAEWGTLPSRCLVVPSTTLVDMVQLKDRVLSLGKRDDSAKRRIIELTFRAVPTQKLVVPFASGPFAGARATGIEHGSNISFFLDPNVGAVDMDLAMHVAINCINTVAENQVKLLMGEELFRWMLFQCHALNESGAYATFRWCELDSGWFCVQNLVVLGRELTDSLNHRAKATVVTEPYSGFGRTHSRLHEEAIRVRAAMFKAVPEESVVDVPSRVLEVLTVADDRVERDERTLHVICKVETFTANEGSVSRKRKMVRVKIDRPLKKFEMILRLSAQANCPVLEMVASGRGSATGSEPATAAIDGVASSHIIEVFSVLGATEKTISPEVVRHAKRTGYMRVDRLWGSISRRVNGTTTGSMGLHVTKTVVEHDSGYRGTFSVYRATPAILLGKTWYNARTLAELGESLEMPTNVRYLMLRPAYH